MSDFLTGNPRCPLCAGHHPTTAPCFFSTDWKLTENAKAMTDYEEAHRLFVYDAHSGRLFYKSTRGRFLAGSPVGTLHKNGYVVFRFRGKRRGAHWVIWLMHKGKFPDATIDHIDRNRSNNRIENLRLATRSQQQGNMALTKANSSGARGVSQRGGKWKATIWTHGVQRLLGTFDTKDAAKAAYAKAAIEHFGEFYQHEQ